MILYGINYQFIRFAIAGNRYDGSSVFLQISILL